MTVSDLSPARLVHARTFASLSQHRNYRLWFIGQVTSVSGTWVQSVAQAWFVVAATHSAVMLGLLTTCQFAPYFVLGLFGGSVADRLDNRRTIIGTQSALGISAAVLALLALSGHLQVWEVFVIAGVNGLVNVLDTPARQAFTVQMVGRSELPNAIALNSSLFNTSRVVGPAIGGLLIATVGVGICFAINALSFLAVIAALVLMHPAELIRPSGVEPRRNLFHESADGIRFAWHNQTIRLALLVMLVISTIGMNFNIWLPILAQQTLHSGPVVFGWLSAMFGAGALTGALVAATMARSGRRALLVGACLFSLSELLLAPLATVWACLVALYFVGLCFTTFTAVTNSAIQLASPDRLRGRIMGLYGYVFFGTAPVGALFVGWLAQLGGTELSFAVAGGVSLVAALAGIAASPLGELRRRRRTGRVALPGPEVVLGRE